MICLIKKKCTEETFGHIISTHSGGVDNISSMKVSYCVNGNEYVKRETIQLNSEPISIKGMPIGVKRIPAIGKVSVGEKVRVLYDPNNPKRAYLPDNKKKEIVFIRFKMYL